jgi:HPt (histidine-containing phosphotransfer) domain-containing protein
MADFLAKPVDIETLAALLARQGQPGSAPEPAAPAPVPDGDFDDEVLQVLCRTLPPARVPGLYKSFVQEVPLSLERLERALQPPDAEALRSAAHAVKGASASLGLSGVARAARDLERAARLGADAATLSQNGEQLRRALAHSSSLCAERGLL